MIFIRRIPFTLSLILVFLGTIILPTFHLQAQAPDGTAGTPVPPSSPMEASLLQPIGIWPYGTARDVVIDDARSLSFVSSGSAVLVLDVSNPTDPSLLSNSIITEGPIEDLDYDPSTRQLYVAAGDGGFEIWDLEDPRTPVQLSLTELYYVGAEIPVMGVAVNDDMAYIAADWGYTHWVDISDPTDPVQVGFFGDNVRPLDIAVVGDYVFAAGNLAGFIPGTLAKFFIQPDGSLDYGGNVNLGGVSHSIFASDRHIFVGRLYSSTLYILDLDLHIVNTFPVKSNGGFVSGDHAYVAGGSSGLHILDISNLADVVDVGFFDSPGTAEDAVVMNGIAYLADGYAGLRSIDVHPPTGPTETGFFDTPGDVSDVFVSEGYAYLPEYGEGLVIVDVRYPPSARIVSTLFSEYAHDVAVQGDYAFVADYVEGLLIIDVSDPENPVEVSVFDAVDNIWDVFVQGNYAYISEVVANEPYWMHIIDISDPTHPIETGSIVTKDAIWEIYVQGDYAYIANYNSGLRMVDISNPSNPKEVGSYSAADVLDVVVQGDYAYVASSDWDGGLLILDISRPARPRLLGRYNPDGNFWPFSVAVSGDTVYAGDPVGEEKIAVLDVNNPSDPRALEILYPAGDLQDLFAVGSQMYLADGKAGLKIYWNSLFPYSALLGSESNEFAPPGGQVIHNFSLQNLGMTDSYQLTLSDNTWSTTLLTASPIRVPSGTSATIEVQVDIPNLFGNNLQSTDSFQLTAQSVRSPDLVLKTNGNTNAVLNPGLALSPLTSLSWGAAGEVVTHTFTLTNTGDHADSFSIELSANSWSTSLAEDAPFSLDPGDSTYIHIAVQTPADTTAFLGKTEDTFTLVVVSGWDQDVRAVSSGTTRCLFTIYLPLIDP